MGFWQRLLHGSEQKSVTSSLDLWREIYGHSPAKSGQSVTYKTAIQVSTVFACMRVRANGIAQVPFRLMLNTPGSNGVDTNIPARDHRLYRVLSLKPNDWQTSFEFRQTLEMHRVLTGNAFAFINRVNGQVAELLPIEPGCVTVKRNKDYSFTYRVTPEGGAPQDFPQESIWHLRGPSWNSWTGLEIVKVAREAIGLAMATEESQATMHKEGVQTTGIISVDGKLTVKQYEELAEWIKKNQASWNAGKPLILDNAAKWLQTQMTGVDAQHLETRKFQVEEVCRELGVFPQMIGYTDKAPTYASAEQFFGAHVAHTLAPEASLWEQSATIQLLSEADISAGLYAKLFLNGLLRGNAKDRGDFYTKLYNVGAINPNEIRGYEDMNPYEGGNQFRVPLNMTDPNDPQEPGEPDAAPEPDGGGK